MGGESRDRTVGLTRLQEGTAKPGVTGTHVDIPQMETQEEARSRGAPEPPPHAADSVCLKPGRGPEGMVGAPGRHILLGPRLPEAQRRKSEGLKALTRAYTWLTGDGS